MGTSVEAKVVVGTCGGRLIGVLDRVRERETVWVLGQSNVIVGSDESDEKVSLNLSLTFFDHLLHFIIHEEEFNKNDEKAS